MQRERVLITVKTYPTLSQSHIELVCTAGLREDGSWIRIYPIPFRLLESGQQFKKWTWVELPLRKRDKDKRPESFSPTDRNDITLGEEVSTSNKWNERRRLLFTKDPAWTDLAALIDAGKRNELSLAVFKPKKVKAFHADKAESDSWDPNKLDAVKNQLKQGDLLDPDFIGESFKPANKLPYDFAYSFEDENGKESKLRILDWEIGMLYWNCLKRENNRPEAAIEKVTQKYEDDFLSTDLHFILGTTLEWHDRGKNPWVIIGVVPFPHDNQMELL